jgi:hypothetical protein
VRERFVPFSSLDSSSCSLFSSDIFTVAMNDKWNWQGWKKSGRQIAPQLHFSLTHSQLTKFELLIRFYQWF